MRKLWTYNCNFLADADNQAAINIGRKGLETLGLSQSKLRVVNPKVTSMSELTDAISNNRETSVSVETEPTNPVQLSLFKWMNCQEIGG